MRTRYKKTAFVMPAMASGRTSIYFFPILFHCDTMYTTKNEPFLSVQLGGIGQGNAVVQASHHGCTGISEALFSILLGTYP